MILDGYHLEPGQTSIWDQTISGRATWPRQRYEAIKTEQGEPAAGGFAMSFGYLATGEWSFASNRRYPFVAEAFDRYAEAHPKSKAVAEVKLVKVH